MEAPLTGPWSHTGPAVGNDAQPATWAGTFGALFPAFLSVFLRRRDVSPANYVCRRRMGGKFGGFAAVCGREKGDRGTGPTRRRPAEDTGCMRLSHCPHCTASHTLHSSPFSPCVSLVVCVCVCVSVCVFHVCVLLLLWWLQCLCVCLCLCGVDSDEFHGRRLQVRCHQCVGAAPP